MSRSTRPLLIVVGGTDLAYRGYCVERVAAAYPIALIDTKPPSEQQHLVVDHEVAATHDPAAVVASSAWPWPPGTPSPGSSPGTNTRWCQRRSSPPGSGCPAIVRRR